MCVVEYVAGVRNMCKENNTRWLIGEVICNLYKAIGRNQIDKLNNYILLLLHKRSPHRK